MKYISPLAEAASRESERCASRDYRRTAIRLVLVTLGAIFGAVSLTLSFPEQRLDPFGIAGLIAFLGVLAVRLIAANDSEATSRAVHGRAVANLIESHSWRYAVGSAPYSVDSTTSEKARELFLVNTEPYRNRLRDYGWASTSIRSISAEMEELRTNSFEKRRDAYTQRRAEPLAEQQGLISKKSDTRYRRLYGITLTVEIIGIPAGILKAIAFSSIDLLSVTAAAAASLSVWIENLNLPERARLAAGICAALNTRGDRLVSADVEHEWSSLVNLTEQQINLNAEAVLATDSLANAMPDPSDAREMGPDEYFAAASELKRKIWEENTPLPKLEPDVIIGLNPGGSILGGILYFMTTRASDFLPLSLRSGLSTTELQALLDNVRWKPRKHNRLSILIVDASVKSGESLREAISLVEAALERAGWSAQARTTKDQRNVDMLYQIRTAAIAKQRIANEAERQVQLDYYVTDTAERFPYGTI